MAAAGAVCLFPGQGSQQVGMGADLSAAFPIARETFAEADDVLGFRLSRLCVEGPADELRLTEHAQPAILVASIAAFRVLRETTGLTPSAVCGHSLGEWSALVAAGALGFADAVRSVRERGRLMQTAVPAGSGAMAAVLGLEEAAVAALCAEAAAGDVVSPANLNGGRQIVVAGHAGAVDRVVALAGRRGGRAQRLAVSAPFHCALMVPAAAGLERVLGSVVFSPAAVPVVTSVEGRPVASVAELPSLLVRQVTAPVRWEDTVRALARYAPRVALEVGPGRVLTGLLRRIDPSLRGNPAGDVEGISRAREALSE